MCVSELAARGPPLALAGLLLACTPDAIDPAEFEYKTPAERVAAQADAGVDAGPVADQVDGTDVAADGGAACLPGGSTSCDDGNPCTHDSCDPASGCVFEGATLDGKPCGDATPCHPAGSCKGGTCQAGKAKVCADGNPCTIDSCEPATGDCIFDSAAMEGQECQGDAACKVGVTCKSGGCIPATTVWTDTLAGSSKGHADGAGADAAFATPFGLAVAATGTIWVADRDNHRIRTITVDGVVATYAGDGQPGLLNGPAKKARFKKPTDIAVAVDGTLYVVDKSNNVIRAISPAGEVVTLAGAAEVGTVDGPNAVARFNKPIAITVSHTGVVYVADTLNHRIRRIHDGKTSTLAGSSKGFADGIGSAAKFSSPGGIAVDHQGRLYVTDEGNFRVRQISPAGEVTTLAGSGVQGTIDGAGPTAQFKKMGDVVVDLAGTVWVADRTAHLIRRINSGVVNTWAGTTEGILDGAKASAKLHTPQGLGLSPTGVLYVSSGKSHLVRRIRNPAGICAIGGACYMDGVRNPSNPCEACVGGKSLQGWTVLSNQVKCMDGLPCTHGDTCQQGQCTATLASCDDGNLCTADKCVVAIGCQHASVADGTACGAAGKCAAGVCDGG